MKEKLCSQSYNENLRPLTRCLANQPLPSPAAEIVTTFFFDSVALQSGMQLFT